MLVFGHDDTHAYEQRFSILDCLAERASGHDGKRPIDCRYFYK